MKSNEPDPPVYRLLIRTPSCIEGEPRARAVPRRRLDHLRVMLRRGHLDARLARGTDPAGNALLSLRAHQLTGRRSRDQLATAIEAALSAADRPRTGFSSAIPVRRADVLAAKATLTAIAQRLYGEQPVSAHGVALVRELVTDGSSALYYRGATFRLWESGQAALHALELSAYDD